MIIFGTRGVTYSAGKGQFFCPSCRRDEPYDQKRVRRFFTLYFIPLIPLDMLGEYVECSACKGTYKLEVLESDPRAGSEEAQAEFQRAIKRVMVLMMLADGAVEEGEIAVIRQVHGKLSGSPCSEEAVRAEIEAARRDSRGIRDYVRGVAPILNDQGKELVVQAALLVAGSDGEFQEEERHAVTEIAQALQMSPAHLQGVMGEMAGKAAAGAA